MAKNLARYIAERTRNGEDLVDRLIELGLEAPASTAAERRIAVAAIEALLERGAGKATQEVSLTLSSGATASEDRFRRLSDEDLEILARLDLVEPESPALAEVTEASNALAVLDVGGDQPLAAQVIDIESED